MACPCINKLSGRICPSCNSVSNDIACLVTYLSYKKDRADTGTVLKACHIDNASDIKENDYLAEIVSQIIEIVFLFISKIIVTLFRLSVSSFRGISGNNKDGCITGSFGNIFLSDLRHDRRFKSRLKIYARSRNSAFSGNRFNLVHIGSEGRIVDSDPRFKDEFWVSEIQAMLDMKKKAEQQALAKYGLDYVTDRYLPEKLTDMGIL